MKRNDLLGIVMYIGIVIGIAIGAALFSKWVFASVMATDWPDWVKYVILR